MTSSGEPLPETTSQPAALASTGSYGGLPTGGAPAASEATESVGPLLGPFQLLQPVRAWRNGTVYAARHPGLQRTVLVRALEGEAAADPATRADFARWIQNLSNVAHPNLAGTVLEASLAGPALYLAQEQSPGNPLSGFAPRSGWERQREGLFPNRRLGLAMLDAARGLAAAHRAGLTHGNLWPDALRVDPDGRVLVARLGDDEAIVAEAVPFAAPAGLGLTDACQRDLYALGASFYVLVTGKPPSENPPPARQLNPGVAAALSGVLARCLAGTGRYASADELAADLEKVLQTETVRVPWNKRSLLVFEAMLVFFAGAAAIALVAKLGFGYQESENGSFPEFMVLGTPALLYLIFTEVFFGRTPLRRWQGFEVADLSGDPASLGRCLSRATVKIGLLAGWCIAFGWFFGRAAEQDRPTEGISVVVNGLMVLLAALYGFSWLTLQYRRYLGEALTGQDGFEAMQLLPHDRLTGTRLVLRRPAPPRAVATAASPGADFGPVTDRIDQYDLGCRLGAGAMGTVYHAWDRYLCRPVALKVLSEALERQPLGRERFEREARLAAQLNHPNVAKVYGVGHKGGRPYIAMELIEGESLEERVRRRGPLPIAEAWGLARQAAQALEAADLLGIVHRDIKPGNLMVTRGGTLKVTDFGVSRRVEGEMSLTETGTVVGTPLYMSPEQATGKPVDARSDMYALGMTLYFLLTGRTAFTARNRMDLLAQQLSGPAPDLAGQVAGLTEEQAAVVGRMLARRPQDRFPSYAALLEALGTESPEQAPPAAVYFRFADGTTHLLCCLVLMMGLFLLVRFGLPAVVPDNWRPGLDAVRAWSPGLLLTAQCLITLLTVLVVVYRPPLQPFPPMTRHPALSLLTRLGNVAWGGLSGLLMLWPTLHRSQGLRVTRWDGRRLRPGRAAWRFAVGYPLLLPWAGLAFLPGLSVEALWLPLGIANLGLVVVSAALLFLHPHRRNLADLAAGTREVRVPPPVLFHGRTRQACPVRPALAIVQTVAVLLFVGGAWGLSGYWLHSFNASQQAAMLARTRAHAQERLRRFEADIIAATNVSSTEARLMTIGCYYLVETQLGRAPSEKGLTAMYSEDCLTSPRGGRIVVVWGADLSGPPDRLAAPVLAFEATPDPGGKRYVLTGDGLVRCVGKEGLQALGHAAGQ